jgi:hypothetical protein
VKSLQGNHRPLATRLGGTKLGAGGSRECTCAFSVEAGHGWHSFLRVVTFVRTVAMGGRECTFGGNSGGLIDLSFQRGIGQAGMSDGRVVTPT